MGANAEIGGGSAAGRGGRRTIVLLNGPPGAGKDTGADLLAAALRPGAARRFKMSQPLKDAVRAMFGWDDAAAAFCEAHKNKPFPELLGLSYRQWQIEVSERLVKVVGGADAFGRLAAARLQPTGEPVAVCSDSGFASEAVPLIPLAGRRGNAPDVLLVRVRRPGTSFAGDSRSYIDLSEHGVGAVWVDNDSTPEVYLGRLLGALARHMGAEAFARVSADGCAPPSQGFRNA